jgi:hypothetical protein
MAFIRSSASPEILNKFLDEAGTNLVRFTLSREAIRMCRYNSAGCPSSRKGHLMVGVRRVKPKKKRYCCGLCFVGQAQGYKSAKFKECLLSVV